MNFDDLRNIPASLCVKCKSTKLLCGKSACPIITKFYSSSNLTLNSNNVYGSSPPSVFVGSFGFPKVRIGPAIPPFVGDTRVYEQPDSWIGKGIEEISVMRFSLYRGYKVIPVKEANSPGNYLSEVHDLLLSSNSVESSMIYSSAERRIDLSPETQPFGPGGYIKKFDHESSSSNPVLEKMYYDTDLKARDGLILLYDSSSLYSIQKMLSAGMLGTKKGRRIVPTRWAITATDKTIADYLLSDLKNNEQIDHIAYYHYRNIGNEYYILVTPGPYSFEMIESWNNGSIWTDKRGSVIEGDYEDRRKHVIEPKIGGSFFAARLPVFDHLRKLGISGRIIVSRFIDGEYTIPLGVWQVRENIRMALKEEFAIDNMERYFDIIAARTSTDLRPFSRTYRIVKNQRKLTDYSG